MNSSQCSEVTTNIGALRSIRSRTQREFHFWDRLKESIKSRKTMETEVKRFLRALAQEIKPAEPDPLPDAVKLAQGRSTLARAKTTSTRLRSLEEHFENK